MHGAKLLLEYCRVHGKAAKVQPDRLSAEEALHQYYAHYFERAGVAYRTPSRLWQVIQKSSN